ncbi:hypothetical protein MMC14_004086 [Varicellaria rhodocarpa]|nr:hypothetical protein [Varicellaria rhodocarpa]
MPSTADSPASPESKVRSTPGAFPSEPESSTVVSSQQTLSQAVHARRAEYTRSQKTRVKVGTWNVAALSGTEKDIGGWFLEGKGVSEALSGVSFHTEDDSSTTFEGHVKDSGDVESVSHQEERASKKRSTLPRNDPGSLPGGDDIGIYVLGLQEIVDISSPTEALRPYNDPHPGRKWKRAVAEALPHGYKLVAEQQLIGLLLLIYASPSIVPTISSISTTSVGTGLMGYMGNKGAVTARIVLGDTTRIVFINCHLAAGTEKGSVERRNWDASQVLLRTKFDPVHGGDGVVEEFGEGIGKEDFAFWFGDLNYRLADLPGDDVRRLLMLHTRNEYDLRLKSAIKIDNELANQNIRPSQDSSSDNSRFSDANDSDLSGMHQLIMLPNGDKIDPASDPTSLHTTISSLLPHDQLQQQMSTRKAFHDGWREGPIEFLPTYKYDVGSVGMFDSSEKKRGPSWCDRILYRTRKDKMEYDNKVREEGEVCKRDEEMKARGLDTYANDDDVLYDYDPETDGVNGQYEEYDDGAATSGTVITETGSEHRLQLDYYTSHQRVLSSDHKPLDAVFTLDYEAVDPVLKAEIQQEVARELDKAENEGRPGITIVVDHHHHDQFENLDEGIDFGHIRYDVSKTRNMTIANTGRVLATFGFIDRPADKGKSGVSPPWLEMYFDRPSINDNPNPNALRQYSLEPGDSLSVDFVIKITDMVYVRSLNEGQARLEDILVLRVYNGRDHFLPVRAEWLQSSFGRSLDKLIRIPEGGVRRLQHQRPDGSGDDNAVKWSAPREVFRLTETLEELVERSLAEWGMRGETGEPPWNVIGWPFAEWSWTLSAKEREGFAAQIRESLDIDQAFSLPLELMAFQKLEVLADVLLNFLLNLEEGVITETIWHDIEKGIVETERAKKSLDGEDKRSWILDILSVSPAHSVSFTFLTFMLARVANELAPIPFLPPTPATPKTSDPLLGTDHALASQDPEFVRRRHIDHTFAEVFSKVMIKAVLPSKGKERKVSQERRIDTIEVFLKSSWEERVSR